MNITWNRAEDKKIFQRKQGRFLTPVFTCCPYWWLTAKWLQGVLLYLSMADMQKTVLFLMTKTGKHLACVLITN